MKNHYVYAVIRRNHHPECHEPNETIDSVWSDKASVTKEIKKQRKIYGSFFEERDIRIKKVKLNLWYNLSI